MRGCAGLAAELSRERAEALREDTRSATCFHAEARRFAEPRTGPGEDRSATHASMPTQSSSFLSRGWRGAVRRARIATRRAVLPRLGESPRLRVKSRCDHSLPSSSPPRLRVKSRIGRLPARRCAGAIPQRSRAGRAGSGRGRAREHGGTSSFRIASRKRASDQRGSSSRLQPKKAPELTYMS